MKKQTAPRQRLLLFLVCVAVLFVIRPAAAQITSGWWFNPTEPGRGYFIEQQGTTLFLAAFLYEPAGRSTWVAASGPFTGMAFQSALEAYSGGQTLTGAYRAPTSGTSPGTIGIQFSSASRGTLTWPGGVVPIERFPITPGGLANPAEIPESGWYWNPAQSGRGFAIEIQSGNIMIAGFMYDTSGNPVWYVSQGPMLSGEPMSYQGQWVEYRGGQTLTGAFVPAAISNPQAGSISLHFSDGANATLTLPDGQPLSLTRFRFGGGSGSGSGTSGGLPDIVRFLNQASFGANDAAIAQVQASGIAGYLDAQLATPPTNYPDFPYFPVRNPPECYPDPADPNGLGAQCYRDNYSLFQLQLSLFRNAMQAPDQLRQRAAWALSQVLVTSGLKQRQAYAMGAYQQLMVRHAFGNFRDLLYDVTRSPVMGQYLDMVNNDKPNPRTGSTPNENYARELMQLFALGVHRLNLDGTPQMDGTGNPIPTYGQEEIEGLAYALTGWTYAPAPVFVLPANLQPREKPGTTTNSSHNPPYFGAPMISVAANHDQSAKRLLNGMTIAAGQTAEFELSAVIDNVFHHPNVGPFIGKQLITKLVTSNPSPAYVARVAAAFNDSGAGVRGDMKAVWRAILLDPEARGDVKTDPNFGRLRDPLLFATGVLRALNGFSDGVYLRGQTATMLQDVFFPPSVFNYYPADYVIPGTAVVGPEFGILNATTTFARYNFVNRIVFGGNVAPDTTVAGATGTGINLTGLQALAADPAQMVEALNRVMFGGAMSQEMRAAIVAAVSTASASDPAGRARTAAYLAATSPQFQVIR